MVKNTKGGNKAKKQARKNNNSDSASTKARLSEDADEIYACCSKLLGNGRCIVLCIDGKERMCIIRNKFRGKGKRGNVLSAGIWCLVGRRDFEIAKENKMENTDLLEVYGEAEKKYIIQKEIALKDKWKIFNNLGDGFTGKNDDDEVMFQRSMDLPPETIDEESESEQEGDEETKFENIVVESKFDYKAPDLGDEVDIDDI